MSPPDDELEGMDALDDELAALLRDPSMWEEPTADLGSRVTAAVANEVSLVREPILRSVPRNVPPSGPAARPSRPSAPTPGRVAALRPNRWLAAAAALLVAIGAWGIIRQRASDDAVRFSLQATDLIPGAQGKVKITSTDSGLRIELDASGLPRRDGTRFYQAWLKGDSGLVRSGPSTRGRTSCCGPACR